MDTPSFSKVENPTKKSTERTIKSMSVADEAMAKLYGQPLDDAGIMTIFRSTTETQEALHQMDRIRHAGRAFAHVIAANTRRNEAQRDAIRAVLHATLVAEQAVRMYQ